MEVYFKGFDNKMSTYKGKVIDVLINSIKNTWTKVESEIVRDIMIDKLNNRDYQESKKAAQEVKYVVDWKEYNIHAYSGNYLIPVKCDEMKNACKSIW